VEARPDASGERDAPVLRVLGDAGLVLVFGDRIDAAVNARVLAVREALRAAAMPGVLDIVPAYATLTVLFDPACCAPAALAQRLLGIAAAAGSGSTDPRREIEIPVCYDPEFAPDMDVVCDCAGLARDEVVRRHTAAAYRVHFLGFTPGFPYLGGLDPALATPRRATPRAAVPAGAVAIGGAQTGVYPQRAPGGWQIIGRTPLALFDARRDPPCLLAPGDTVQFVAIDARAWLRLCQNVD
jgi:KipI family sensor histidine kinase inhibitor